MAKEKENENKITDEQATQDLAQKELELKEKEDIVNQQLQVLDEKILALNEKMKEFDDKSKKVEEELTSFASSKEYSKADLIADSKSVGEILSKQKKVNITIPMSELNPLEKNVPVTINGYTYNIKRGEMVEVPIEVYNILKESKYI